MSPLQQDASPDPEPVFVGVDVAKATLDVFVDPHGDRFTVDNSPEGIRRLVERLAGTPGVRLAVVEATGRYHRRLAADLMAAGVPVAVANPRHVREFARAKGKLAKTDAIGLRRDVKALVFGHTHVWSHKRMENGLHLVNLPAVAYVFKPEQPSGWVDCVLGDGGAKMTLNCLDKKHPKHGEALKLEWRG